MDQVALAIQDSVDCVGYVPADLSHPQPIGDGRDPTDLYLARRQFDEEQDDEPLQPSAGPHFHSEEIRGYDEFPMPGQKLFPGCLPTPFRCRLDPVPFQNVSNRAASHLVAQIG